MLINSLQVTALGTALAFGLLVGIGYLAAQTLNIAINPNFPHPFRSTVLNAPYFLACSLITSAVITLFA